MRKCSAGIAFFALLLAASTGGAATITVGPGEQYTEVAAGLAAASAGDTVLVKPGTYHIQKLEPASGISLLGEAGPVQTKLFASNGDNAFDLDGVTGVRIEGFDIYADPTAGGRTNGLIHMDNCTDIYIGNCFIHDASPDADVVKLIATQDLIIDSCIIWNPSERTTSPGNFQECIDIRGHGDARVTVRNSWLFHEGSQGDYLIYAKGGTTDLLWENNIFGPSAGEGWSNVPVETGHLVHSDDTQYESENFVVRNNLLVGLKGSAAFAFAGPKVSLLYNNVFYNNQNVNRAMIELSANPALAGGPALQIYSANNIFYQNGSIQIYRVRDQQTGANLIRDYNVYQQGNSGGDLNLADETHSITVSDPLFVAPAIPQFDDQRGTEQVLEILRGFRLQQGSTLRGTGVNIWTFAAADHPTTIDDMSQRNDAFGNTRPTGASWDPGLHQYTPNSDAGPNADVAAPDAAGPNADAAAPNVDAAGPNPDAAGPNIDAAAPTADAATADAATATADAAQTDLTSGYDTAALADVIAVSADGASTKTESQDCGCATGGKKTPSVLLVLGLFFWLRQRGKMRL